MHLHWRDDRPPATVMNFGCIVRTCVLWIPTTRVGVSVWIFLHSELYLTVFVTRNWLYLTVMYTFVQCCTIKAGSILKIHRLLTHSGTFLYQRSSLQKGSRIQGEFHMWQSHTVEERSLLLPYCELMVFRAGMHKYVISVRIGIGGLYR